LGTISRGQKRDMFNLFKKKQSSGVFIPDGNDFKEVADKIEDASLNGISIHLGYHPDQLHFYYGQFNMEFDIHQVAFEFLTDNVAFVLTKKTVDKVDKKKLQYFLKDFKTSEEFDSVTIRDTLQSGVENKSLKKDFLTKVLGLEKDESDGGVLFSDRIGMYLYFSNGYLTDFQSADGLNEWTKYLRELNETLFNSYVKVAQKYWGDNRKMVENEINIQGQSLASTPHALKNEFVDRHRVEFGTINFFMLLVCHYNQDINEDTFKLINHERYKQLDSDGDVIKKYRYNDFILSFSDSGQLIEIVK